MAQRISVLVAALLLAACGGGIDTGGISGDALVEELEPQQNKDLCEATVDYANETIGAQAILEFNCYVAGLSASLIPINIGGEGAMVPSCQDIYTMCLAGESQNAGNLFDIDDCRENETIDNCSATVDELVACSEDSIDQLGDLVGTINCQSNLFSLAASLNIYSSEACNAVRQKCPNLFETSTVTTTNE